MYLIVNLIFSFYCVGSSKTSSDASTTSSLEFDPDANLLKCHCDSCQSVRWLKNANFLPNHQQAVKELQLENVFEIQGKHDVNKGKPLQNINRANYVFFFKVLMAV